MQFYCVNMLLLMPLWGLMRIIFDEIVLVIVWVCLMLLFFGLRHQLSFLILAFLILYRSFALLFSHLAINIHVYETVSNLRFMISLC